jgi:hypothetical protein
MLIVIGRIFFFMMTGEGRKCEIFVFVRGRREKPGKAGFLCFF